MIRLNLRTVYLLSIPELFCLPLGSVWPKHEGSGVDNAVYFAMKMLIERFTGLSDSPYFLACLTVLLSRAGKNRPRL